LGWFVRGNVITRGNQNRLDEMLNKGLHYLWQARLWQKCHN